MSEQDTATGTEPARPGPETVVTDDRNRAVEAESPPGDQNSPESAPGEGDKRSRNRGAEKRIRRLTAKHQAAEKQLQDAEEEIQRLQRENAALQSRMPKPAKPKLADFGGDHDAFGEAYATWKAQDAEAAKRESKPKPKPRRSTSGVTQAEIESFLRDGAAELGEEFKAAQNLASRNKFGLSEAMTEFLLESDKGAELFIELSKNPDRSGEIAQMTAIQSARAMLDLESTLQRAHQRAAAHSASQGGEPAPAQRDSRGRYAKRGSGTKAPPPGPTRDGSGGLGTRSIYDATVAGSGNDGDARHRDLSDWMQQRREAQRARDRRR